MHPDKSKSASATAASQFLHRAWNGLKDLKKLAGYDSPRRSEEVEKVQAASTQRTFHEATIWRGTMWQHERASWEEHMASGREQNRVLREHEDYTGKHKKKTAPREVCRQEAWEYKQLQKEDAEHTEATNRSKTSENILPKLRLQPFVFRLADFPPEIRDIIFLYSLDKNTSKCPALLTALRGYSNLFLHAREIYYQSNNFSFSVLQGHPIDQMTQKALESMRDITLMIPQINICTHLTSNLFLACNIRYLTLTAFFGIDLHIVIMKYIPEFMNLKILAVQMKRNKGGRLQSSRHYYSGTYGNGASFASTLNTMLGETGKIEFRDRSTTWIWEAKGPCFTVRRPQTHIKFSD